MKLKNIHYIFVLIISLFVMMGCEGSSSSDNQPASQLSEESETVAIYIPMDKINAQKVQSNVTVKSTLSSKKISKPTQKNTLQGSVEGDWTIYDNNPNGTTIQNIYDDLQSNQVIEFNGDGLKNGYVLGYTFATNRSWNETKSKTIKWDISFSEAFTFYLRINTPKGYRYLYYTASDYNYGVLQDYDAPHYIHHGLGANATDGAWRTITRNVESDLKEFEPNNTVTSIEGLFVRGSGRINKVTLMSESTPTPPSTDEAIDAWLKSQELVNISRTNSQTRAVLYASEKNLGERYYKPNLAIILDISDLNNIQELNREKYYHRSNYSKATIKDGEYIMISSSYSSPGGSSVSITLYNHETGKKASTIEAEKLLPCKDENFIISFTGTYTPVYTIKKVDFSDINNPVSITLDQHPTTDNQGNYSNISKVISSCSLSSDRKKLLLKDARGNLIREIKLTSTSS